LSAPEPVRDLVVLSREEAADSIVVLTLADPHGAALPPWTPGAHIDLVLTAELVRQYSLCGALEPDDRWRIAVLREAEGRGGSAFVHERLVPGTRVTARGPRNHFELVPAKSYLFIAGGIGITPLLPMMAAAERNRVPWRLHYGGRTLGSMAFRDELEASYGPRIALTPQDRFGLLDLTALLAAPQPDTAVYCCGPEPLLVAVEQQLAHWPGECLHVERFAPKAVGPPAWAESFEVELAQSGLVVPVPPDRSILDVVRDAGVDVLSSCEEGTCGTCETPILSGAADHRDSVLTAAEHAANDTMMICVSRAACPRLVLDL
jgi:ferredoxin-NADP reductase